METTMLDNQMLELVRDAYKSEKDTDIMLSNEVLSSVIENNDQWDDLSDDAKIAFIEQAQLTAQSVMVSDPGITVLVNKMDADFHTEVRACIDAVVKGKTTAVDIYAHFRRIYSKTEMDGMPYPGTEAEHVIGNQRPDKTKTKDVTGKPITVVWTNDFVSAMPEGKEFEGMLDNISKELKAVGSVPALKGKSKSEIAAMRSDATAKRNALRSMVKRAINLHHQWEAINSMPLVGVRWIKGSKEKGITIPEKFGDGDYGKFATVVTLAPKPIWIYPKDEPENGRDFSVTQFLAFDAALALKNGGKMSDLTDTAGRGVTTDNTDSEGDGSAMPLEAAELTISQVVNFLDKRENMAIVRKIIADKRHPDSDDMLEQMCMLALLTMPIYNQNKTRFDELQNGEEKDERKTA